MNALNAYRRFGFLSAACAVTLTLLTAVSSMATPNTAEAWVAKAPVAAVGATAS